MIPTIIPHVLLYCDHAIAPACVFTQHYDFMLHVSCVSTKDTNSVYSKINNNNKTVWNSQNCHCLAVCYLIQAYKVMKLVDVILSRELLVNSDLSSTQPDLMGCVAVPLSEGFVIGNLHRVELITFSRMHPTNYVYTFSSTLWIKLHFQYSSSSMEWAFLQLTSSGQPLGCFIFTQRLSSWGEHPDRLRGSSKTSTTSWSCPTMSITPISPSCSGCLAHSSQVSQRVL